MAARHVGRLSAWIVACVATPAVLGTALGRLWILAGAAVVVGATLWLVLWLPRAAHGAFETARYRRAGRRYRVLAATAFSSSRERAAVLSRAACEIAAGAPAAAEPILAGFDGATLSAAERVTWLNNRACIALDGGRDPQAALGLIEEAVALRPDVPAVQHTRAAALIALGRFDEAIAILDAMRTGGELSPTLEAMRCRDLATAWDHKGQPAYAADYRERARLVGG